VFPNFNRVILDVVEDTIGDRTQIGPGVQILAADHPRDPAVRASGLEFGRPVRIGRNVWIGAGAIILTGVSIGDDALIARAAWSPVVCPPGLPPSESGTHAGPGSLLTAHCSKSGTVGSLGRMNLLRRLNLADLGASGSDTAGAG
jgi:hypothetical protein